MIRGISFLIPNKRFPALSEILEGIDVNKYFWVLAKEDVLDDYFKKDRYPGDEFKTVIQIEKFYSIGLYLQAYSNEKDIEQLNDYANFKKSQCQMVIFIYDAVFSEIYAKDADNINTIMNNAKKHGYVNVEYITDENDMRYRFSL